MQRKMISFFVILLTFLLFVSCRTEHPPGSNTGNTEITGTEPPGTGADSAPVESEERLILALNGSTEYQIISSMPSVDANVAVREFVSKIKDKTGAEIPVYSSKNAGSTPERETEILIGKIDARTESLEAYQTLSYSSYSICVVGKKICINTYSDIYLKKELSLLLEAITGTDGEGYGIPGEYELRRDMSAATAEVPVFEGGTLKGVNEAGAGNFEATFTGAAAADFTVYLAKLSAAGFAAYDENELSGNLFGTYLKDGTQVNVSFYPSKGIFKLVYGEQGYLPALDAAETARLCTPSVFQPGRRGADLSSPNGAPGMSYVLQLSDGRYIIVDGGPANTDDEEALLAYLREHMPQGSQKPVIAAWFITHAHGDHMGLASNFLQKYRNEVVLELAAYNFPAFESITIVNESAAGMGNLASTFKRIIDIYYPDAQTLVFHTGQRFWIGDAEIEIFYTPEDYAPAAFPWGNHTSSAFRVRLGGKSILFLGDCEKDLCQFMADVYGDCLGSDMLQLSHHGYNGACLDLYQFIDPDICFWASDEYRFLNDPRCLGTASGYDFNKWIRDDSVKKREHYHSSADTTILLTDEGGI